MINLSLMSIRAKLIATTMLASTAALLVAAACVLYLDFHAKAAAIKQSAESMGQFIGEQTTTSLMLRDMRGVFEDLQVARFSSSLRAACLYADNGSYVASYGRTPRDYPCPDTLGDAEFALDARTDATWPILVNAELVGTVVVKGSLDEAYADLRTMIMWCGLVGVAALGFLYLLAARLQALISEPIQHLSDTVNEVSLEKNYEVRAQKSGDDELGLLVDAFNGMLDTIERQNVEIRASERRYRDLYEINPELILTLDTEGRILSANSAGIAQLGYSPDEVVGRYVTDFTLGDSKQELQDRILKGMEHDLGLGWEIRLMGASREPAWFRYRLRHIEDEDGRFTILFVAANVTEARKLSDELSYQATHDALTNLVNRREFERRLSRVINSAKTEDSTHVLCYVDLDQFKVINDTCGHVAGDELLKQMAGVFEEQVRMRDTIARLGGDEFGVLMEHCSVEHGERAAEAIIEAISKYRFSWKNQIFKVGASIGLVTIDKFAKNLGAIMSEADSACYIAKERGRNRAHLFSPTDDMLIRREQEMHWVARLHEALDEGNFRIFKQRIVATSGADDEGEYFEVLLRMCHGNELILPGAFLPAAERYQVASLIDAWVIEETFRYFDRYPEAAERLHMCSINLSGVSLSDANLLTSVEKMLADAPALAGKLCFEITETAAISNVEAASSFMSHLQSRGCRFALDDFGSGVSSFAYLRSLPVDLIKIDGSFVREILTDRVAREMVRSIREVGRVMGKQTVAEFVENENIFMLLRQIGVDFAQGYGIHKPIPMVEPFVELKSRVV